MHRNGMVMINNILRFFEQFTADSPAAARGDLDSELRIAVASLLLEMMRVDYQVGDAERATVVNAIRGDFSLGAEEAAALIKVAEAERQQAPDYYQFTSRINKRMDLPRKIALVEQLWRVAYADGRLDKYEDHLMHKIGDLLYVPHLELMAAKHRARQATGGTPED